MFPVGAFFKILLTSTHHCIGLVFPGFVLHGSTPAPSGRLTGPMPEGSFSCSQAPYPDQRLQGGYFGHIVPPILAAPVGYLDNVRLMSGARPWREQLAVIELKAEG